MTADLLRRAAARAQELTEGATDGQWCRWTGMDPIPPGPFHIGTASTLSKYRDQPVHVGQANSRADAALIAACDPPFLRAVGEWLEVTARGVEPDRRSLSEGGPYVTSALAVARALLGEDEA